MFLRQIGQNGVPEVFLLPQGVEAAVQIHFVCCCKDRAAQKQLFICGIHGKEATEEEIATELARRKERWQPRPPKYTTGALGLFTRNAASPMKGGYMD